MKAALYVLLSAFLCAGVSGVEIPSDIVQKKYALSDTKNQVWVYLPANPAGGSLPCVLIAGAGTRMFHGIRLAEGDVAEHLPYVRAGFAVVAYGLSGPWPDKPTDATAVAAITAFIASHGGLDDAGKALSLAKKYHPTVDLGRVFVVGHSSAAVVALNIAEHSTKVLGCVAYAPPTDLEKRFGEATISKMDSAVKGFRSFVQSHSPYPNAALLKCPVMVFNARDDSKITPDSIHAYVDRLKQEGKTVQHVEVATGDHYDSMLKEGIPAGIKWMQEIMKSRPSVPVSTTGKKEG